ncbi:MAG: type IX secretion system membrane protein PorP/SprF [Flavobacteriales bacterium]|nr:type IX secretion system membrane protein PorP/SprF [Flavobacteriales bacterium]
MREIILILSVLLSVSLFAQQEPLFTQYYNNDMAINPAVSGSKTYNSLSMQTRQQWLGFEGAPLSTNINYHGALNNRSAMGGYLMFDKANPSLQANLQLNYAYHIPLNYEKVNLSFGVGAKLMYYNLDFNKEDLPPGIDPAYSASAYENTLGDVSAGTYLYGRNFYLGFSASNLLQSTFKTPIRLSPVSNKLFRNYYTMGAYRFNIMNRDWQLEPSFLLRKMELHSNVTDITTRIIYLEDTWTGLTYRTDGTLVFGFGFVANKLHISYTYEHTFTGEIMQYAYGTHEIGLSLRIKTLASQRHIGFWGY